METITSNAKDIECAVRMLLSAIGEDPDREEHQNDTKRDGINYHLLGIELQTGLRVCIKSCSEVMTIVKNRR